MMRIHTPFVLASRSPRRQHLLRQIGFEFEVHVSRVEEVLSTDMPPEALVEDLALSKAIDVAEERPAALVLGADTIVVLEGEVLGKPSDAAEARSMLRRLSGRTHTVFTGIALVHLETKRKTTASEATRVTFAVMDDREIASYVESGSPLDKAGAYGIQDDRGALFVSRIEGDYYNVVGLPLHRLYRTLRASFSDLLTQDFLP